MLADGQAVHDGVISCRHRNLGQDLKANPFQILPKHLPKAWPSSTHNAHPL
jgi:hypothetical protein